jgi:hypothetical protein
MFKVLIKSGNDATAESTTGDPSDNILGFGQGLGDGRKPANVDVYSHSNLATKKVVTAAVATAAGSDVTASPMLVKSSIDRDYAPWDLFYQEKV